MPNPKIIRKIFSLTESDIVMLTELQKTGFLSMAETIRFCIRLAHKRQFPYYKKVAEVKEEKVKALKEIRNLPLEEFVKTILHGDLETRPGYVHLTHKDNPTIVADIPVDVVRNYISRNNFWASIHQPLEKK